MGISIGMPIIPTIVSKLFSAVGEIVYFFHKFGYSEVLRAFFHALSALDAVGGSFIVGQRAIRIIERNAESRDTIVVIEGKNSWYLHAEGTGHTIFTASARHGAGLIVSRGDFIQEFLFLFGKRFKIAHCRNIIRQLLHCIHAAEYDLNVREGGRIA